MQHSSKMSVQTKLPVLERAYVTIFLFDADFQGDTTSYWPGTHTTAFSIISADMYARESFSKLCHVNMELSRKKNRKTFMAFSKTFAMKTGPENPL